LNNFKKLPLFQYCGILTFENQGFSRGTPVKGPTLKKGQGKNGNGTICIANSQSSHAGNDKTQRPDAACEKFNQFLITALDKPIDKRRIRASYLIAG
jgi:hypothetical protein